MGCVGSKHTGTEYSYGGSKERIPLNRKESADKLVSRANSSRREEIVRPSEDIKVMLINKDGGPNRFYDNQAEKNDVTIFGHLGLGRLPKSAEGELVVAGWPSWLAAAAGESLKGWIPRRATSFDKLEKIGQGTYSSVYKARDLIHNKLVALKKVRFDNHDPESIKFMAREIVLLRRLDHPNVIKLEGLITSQISSNIYLVFEYMEHDLVGLTSIPDIKFSEPQIKCYMKQLLSGLDHCHSRGVLHRDIKGSNLLIDSDGILKIADFGLASPYDPFNSALMTSRVVTLWYRPPELLLGASHYGVSVDLWSAGCILGELYDGKPILPGKTEVEQLHKIFKLCGSPSEDYWRKSKLPYSTSFKPVQPYRRCVAERFKNFPSPALNLVETLLSIDPVHRGTAAFALKSELFTAEPLPCDPSSLPKYPPSKEIDAKLRDEEARRQRETVIKGQRIEVEIREPKESVATANANAELTSIQRRQQYPNSKGRTETFDFNKPDAVPGLFIDPARRSQAVREGSREFSENNRKKASHSGPLVSGAGWGKPRKEGDDRDPQLFPDRTNLSKFSGLVESRTLASEQQRAMLPPEVRRSQKPFNQSASAAKQEHRSNTQKISASPQMGSGRSFIKETTNQPGRDSRGNKIYMSGPLLLQSDNVEQMLKEHDRKIQEFARRARVDKNRPGRVQLAQGRGTG